MLSLIQTKETDVYHTSQQARKVIHNSNGLSYILYSDNKLKHLFFIIPKK